MGVPSLYRWLTNRYPEIKRPVSTKSNFYADNLYLDFNAIIHPCCNKDLNTMSLTDKQLYANLTNYMDKIVNIIRPRKLLYISVDGVSPRAKLNQQRSRRFVKAKESMEQGEVYFSDENTFGGPDDAATDAEPESDPGSNRKKNKTGQTSEPAKETFDSNAITPGTRFMERLDCFIKELIKSRLSEDPLWKGISVIYTGYKVPGEGEQKILEYMRKHQKPSARHVIYSPDADLIFLGLTLFDYNVFIMREEQKKPFSNNGEEPKTVQQVFIEKTYEDKDFILVDIQKLKGFLITDFRSVIKFDFDYKNFLKDWVFMCFSIGNDFLPSAPCFEIRTNAIDKITSIMLGLFIKTRRYITNGKDIDFDVLKGFFLECAKREDEFLIEKNRNLVVSRTRMNLAYDENLEFALNNEKGKIRFYMEKMNIFSEAELLVACKEYIKGLVWIYNYYFYMVPSWDWYYPYHFAPFMGDLALVSNVQVHFSLNRPLRPMEQLLAVLPPHSKKLIPECLQDVFEEHKEMYPSDFKIDAFQKCMDWQAVPILPFVEISKITKGFSERQALLTYEEANRNIVGYAVLYSKHPQAIKKGKVLYSSQKAFEIIALDEYTGKIFPLAEADEIGQEVDRFGFKYSNAVVAFSFDQRYGNYRNKK